MPHGTTTAFRSVTKRLTAQTILSPNLEELNIKLAILQREIDLAKLPLNTEEGPATRDMHQDVQAGCDLQSTSSQIQSGNSASSKPTPCFLRVRKASPIQSVSSSQEEESLPSGEQNDTPYPHEQIKAIERAEANLSQLTFGGSEGLTVKPASSREELLASEYEDGDSI